MGMQPSCRRQQHCRLHGHTWHHHIISPAIARWPGHWQVARQFARQVPACPETLLQRSTLRAGEGEGDGHGEDGIAGLAVSQDAPLDALIYYEQGASAGGACSLQAAIADRSRCLGLTVAVMKRVATAMGPRQGGGRAAPKLAAGPPRPKARPRRPLRPGQSTWRPQFARGVQLGDAAAKVVLAMLAGASPQTWLAACIPVVSKKTGAGRGTLG